MEGVHELLLDFIPLTDDIYEQNRIFAELLQKTALEILLEENPPVASRKLAALERLLLLACDLGYIEPEVLKYLQRQLQRIHAANTHALDSADEDI